jgi:membrane associated rhomboid family serine protease
VKTSLKAVYPYLKIPLFILIVLWAVQFLQWFFQLDLSFLGVYPRKFSGLIGIFTMPLVHGSWSHIASNSFSFFIFLVILFYSYKNQAFKVLFFIWITTGLWLWCFARPAWHIGASGVIFGLFAFIFITGILSKKPELIAISLLIWFINAGALWGLLPTNKQISWEGHLLGLLSGALAAFYFFYEVRNKTKAKIWKPDDDFSEISSTAEILIHYFYKKK